MSKRIVLNFLFQMQMLTNYRNPSPCYFILFYLGLRNPCQSNIT